MSTRSQDRSPAPQGNEPEARKTTQQSMIAAVGASGAVIAGGITTFVLLVGVVSFDVWPMSDTAGPGTSTELSVVGLTPEPASEAPAALVPFGSSPLVTEPAVVAAVPEPSGDPARPKLAGGRGIGRGDEPSTPVAQAPEGGEGAPGGGGTVAAGAEEPIPQEPADDETESDADDQNGRPQRPSRPVRPVPPAPAPAPAPAPVSAGATTVPADGDSSSGGGPGGSGSSGNGNHGGRG